MPPHYPCPESASKGTATSSRAARSSRRLSTADLSSSAKLAVTSVTSGFAMDRQVSARVCQLFTTAARTRSFSEIVGRAR